MGLYEAKCNFGRYRVGQVYDIPDDRLDEIGGHLAAGRLVSVGEVIPVESFDELGEFTGDET